MLHGIWDIDIKAMKHAWLWQTSSPKLSTSPLSHPLSRLPRSAIAGNEWEQPSLCQEYCRSGSQNHTRSSQGAKLISWYFRQGTTEPLNTSWNSSHAKFFHFGSQCNFLRANSMQHTATTKQHSSYNIEPCNKHSTFVITFFCRTPPALGVAKTSNNRARSSPIAGHFLSGPRPTFRALAILRSSSAEFLPGPLEPFTAPGHSNATQLLQPNFQGIGHHWTRGRLLHSHGQSLQQMKQWPQCFHKCHGCATWTKHFACRKCSLASMCTDNLCHFHVVHQKQKPQHCAQLLANPPQSPLTPCNTNKVSKMYIVTAIITPTSTKATGLYTVLARVLSIIHPQPMSKSSVLSC